MNMNWIKGAGTIVVTLFIFAIVGVWLYFTAAKLGVAPVFNAKGVLIIDQYQRAKDILLIIFPLATTAVGYWLGNQGTVQAQKQADTAVKSAQDAHTQARMSQAQVAAILGASSDTDLIQKATAAAPAAFAEVTQVPRLAQLPTIEPEGPTPAPPHADVDNEGQTDEVKAEVANTEANGVQGDGAH